MDDDGQDDVDNIHAIIDPNEFVAAAEDAAEDAVANEDGQEELGQNEDDGPPPADDIGTQVERYYQDTLKPLINRLNLDAGARATHRVARDIYAGPVSFIDIYDPMMWRILIFHDDYRHEFLDAIQHEAKQDDSELKDFDIYWRNAEFGDPDVPWDKVDSCVLDLGLALSALPKLEHVTMGLSYHTNFEILDEIASTMLQTLHANVKVLKLSCKRRRDDPMPDQLVRVIRNLPHLHKLVLYTELDGALVGLLCGNLVGQPSLRSFGFSSYNTPIPLNMEQALAVGQLLRANTLTSFSIYNARFANHAVSNAIYESLAASLGLEKISLGIFFDDEEAEGSKVRFFRHLGQALPSLKHLLNLNISIAMSGENEPDSEECMLALLAGIAHTPSIVDLGLHMFAWTTGLAQAMADCLLRCKSIRRLNMVWTSVSSENASVLSVLGPALESCLLESFCCVLSGSISAAAVDISSAVGRNRCIRYFSLHSYTHVPVDTVREVFASFHNNDSLKQLELALQLVDDRESGDVPDEAAFRRLLAAIEANVGLEQIGYRPRLPVDDERGLWLKDSIDRTTELNRLGRRYIRAPNAPDFLLQASQVLSGTERRDCLFMHLHEVPALFQRRRDDL